MTLPRFDTQEITMKKLAILALVAAAAPVAAFAADDSSTVRAEAAAPVQVSAGKMLYASNGYRLAPVYRVNAEGNPQVILDGKLVTIPASTLSDVNGKVTTSLSKKDISNGQ
jgi:hypothetical protein